MSSRIIISPYDAEWPAAFLTFAGSIRTACPPGSTLHHIGSTAVPGLAAKATIDLQLTVHGLADVDVEALGRAGFEHVPGVADHLPAGHAWREHDLRKLYFRLPPRAAHLHVRERGRPNQRYALLCRDFLRANQHAAAAYEAAKRALAARFADDASAYYAVKDPMFDLIMAGAELWTEKVGWTEPPPDA